MTTTNPDPTRAPVTPLRARAGVNPAGLLRLVAGSMWWVLADAICCDAGISCAVRVRSGGSFGVGHTWGRYAVEPHGIDVYRQHSGATLTVTWADVRAIRAQASATALEALAAASAYAKSGPPYRLPTLPVHLRPEGLDPAMTEADLTTARRAEHDQWVAGVYRPFWAHDRKARARLAAAFDAVLVDEPADLLDLLAAITGDTA